MLVCVTNYLILSFGAGEAFLDDNKFILFYFFIIFILLNLTLCWAFLSL
ncbi:hypothetical protein AAJ76_11500068 [Vairimorpha ceranae]|uniref:Uncharacterized protein n=1 Tax=Vairimorpha ceranae TaxID=40302 RepID=A0A0F9W8U0_9MICR|nr:hypothetical protein AAJ76_11500068 [Vairimorpha ceranae]KKO74121.1 hypothetical protein AAJ76_11500068 [Vairimorpha ceranae]